MPCPSSITKPGFRGCDQVEVEGLYVAVVGTPGSLRNSRLLQDLRLLGVHNIAVSSRDLRGRAMRELDALLDPTEAWTVLRRALTDGELGCALSHRDHWDAARCDGADWVLVLEDDAYAGSGLSEAVRLAMALPRDTPTVVALYDSPTAGMETPVFRRPVSTGTRVSLYLCLYNTNGTLGYVANRAALRLLTSAPRKVICPADWPPAAGQVEFLVAWPHPLSTNVGDQHSTMGASRAPRVSAESRLTKPWRTYIGRYWKLRHWFPDYASYFKWAYGSGRGFLKHAGRLGLVRQRVVTITATDPQHQTVASSLLEAIAGRRRRYRSLGAEAGRDL